MGFLDAAKAKAEEFLKDNPDKVEDVSDQAINKAGDLADSATGGKFSDQIDQAQAKADEAIGD